MTSVMRYLIVTDFAEFLLLLLSPLDGKKAPDGRIPPRLGEGCKMSLCMQ